MYTFLGGSHQSKDLDDFAKLLIEKIADKKVTIFDKEESLLGLVKQFTRLLSDWDNDTAEMIKLLHGARDKQVI